MTWYEGPLDALDVVVTAVIVTAFFLWRQRSLKRRTKNAEQRLEKALAEVVSQRNARVHDEVYRASERKAMKQQLDVAFEVEQELRAEHGALLEKYERSVVDRATLITAFETGDFVINRDGTGRIIDVFPAASVKDPEQEL